MIKLFGIGLSLVGISHFFAPDLYRSATQIAFPENTDQAIQINGAAETGLGALIACKKTRKLGLFGLFGYVGWLGYNAANQ